MGFKCGIVGLPNVGKSTIFNALTSANVPVENYPFSTISPNVGIVKVPDERLTRLAEIVKPERVVPTTLEFVDIAGLVEGSSKGEGLGNQFLAHIRNVDAIAHVVRCFRDENVAHIAPDINPSRDIEIVDIEIALKDMETIENRLSKLSRSAKTGDKAVLKELEVLSKLKEELDSGNPIRSVYLSEDQAEIASGLFLLSAKPVMYVANIGEEDFSNEENPLVAEILKIARERGDQFCSICGKLEEDLQDFSPAERDEYLREMGIEQSGIETLINPGYDLLNLI
ncbi:MAG: redox-regulated ATPase YchF, partial [Fidelibacterota bacterium]